MNAKLFKTLPILLGLLLPQASAQSQTSCGIPNTSNPPIVPRCDPADSESSGDPSQGPAPSAPAPTVNEELDLPTTTIAVNHGGALLQTTDLRILGSTSGIPLNFTRYYNSRDAEGLGDLMGHGRTWTHSWSWRMSTAGSSRRIFFPSGRMLEFAPAGASTYLGQASVRYVPALGNGELMHQVGNFWYLVVPGGITHVFERVVRADSTVIYHPRSSRDSRGNVLTYISNTAARITKVIDSAGNFIQLNYSQEVVNRRVSTALHTITAPPVVGWNEVIIPAGQAYRWIQAVSAPVAYFDISEIKFYKANGSGGYALLGGTQYGNGPAENNSVNTFDKVFDGSGSTRFTFCRPNGGVAGLDLGVNGAAAVTKIRYYIVGSLSGELDKFVGMTFSGMTEQPENFTVLSSVTASTGQTITFDYGTFLDTAIGQSHTVLEKVQYKNAANQLTDEATLTWVAAQEGAAPCVLRSNEPRNTTSTPDVSFDYLPGHIAVKGQPSQIKTGNPSAPTVLLTSNPENTHQFTAPDGGVHTIVNPGWSAYLPPSATDAAGKVTDYTWTSGRFLASRTTTAGTTTFTRNAQGQPLTTTHPDGLVETNTFDTLGRVLTESLAAPGQASRTTTYTRNTDGRVTRVTYPDTSYEDYTYNTFGLVATVRETNGSFTQHTYGSAAPIAGLRLTTSRGRATATATTGGETTSFTYHLPGNASGSPVRLLASETDPRGRTTAYEYDYAGRILKTTYPDGSFRQVVLDAYGNKLNEFDGSSLEEWTYDDFRRPLTHTDAANGVTTYDYGINGTACSCYGAGAPTLITSPAGRKTRRYYDLKGRLTQEIQGFLSADAASTTHIYNALGRRLSTTGPDGQITTYNYDSMGRTTRTTLAPYGLNLATSHTYSAFGDTLTTTAPGGRTTTMAYDKMSRAVSMTDPLGTVTTQAYDLGGRRIAVTEGFGTALARTTSFGYDLLDRMTLTTYPDSTTNSQTYHPGSDPHTSTDELGRVTTQDTALVTWTDSKNFTWTSFASTTTDAAGFTTTSYGPPMAFTGGTRRIVSGAGRIAESYMDELGRTTLIRSGLVTATSGLTADMSDTVMTHDPDGMVLTSTTDSGGLNLTTTQTYDALGRLKTSTDPLNRTTTRTYDKRGNLLKTTLPDNREHTATYDALSRQVTSTDPKNQTITYTYWNETSSQLTLKDARNFTTTWTYNLRGQLLTKVYPNGDDHAYTYDALGRMATHTTPNNDVCTYSYDLRDRQTLANWNTTTPDTARTYWANGLIKSIDNGVSKSEFAYNTRNFVTAETQTLTGRPARVVSYDYDADGLRSSLQGGTGGSPVSYTWTARAQLHTLSNGNPPPLATYIYDKAGRNTALVHENTITESKSYDAASQLQSNTHLKNGTPTTGHGYTLDATGRRTAETFADGSTPTRSYGYDTADQVTTATYGSSQSDTYAYDPMGNRQSASTAFNAATTTYTANSVNQYTSATGLTPITHDANGNLLLQNGVTYTWDSENRLLSVSDAQKRIEHAYDGQHRRVTSKVLNLTLSTTEYETQFIYDSWNVIEEYALNPLNSVLLRTRTRTWGQDLSGSLQGAGGVGGLLLTEEINGSITTAYHFHYDGNGNVTEITDLSGNKAASYRYDAFGNTLVTTGSYAASNRYRFSTKPLDSVVTNAPLYYYGYRYYDPMTGRWPSRDPIEERGGLNLYGFVENAGTNKWDNLGLVPPVVVAGCYAVVYVGRFIIQRVAAGMARQAAQKKARECTILAAAVQAAKTPAENWGSCDPNDSCTTLAAKKAAWLTLVAARQRLHNKCFNGGDGGHQQQVAQHWRTIGNCATYYASKCLSLP